MSVLASILKRSVYPVETPCGVVHVRELTFDELTRVKKVDDNERTGLMYALSLVAADGQTLFPRKENESDSEWSARMLDDMQSIEGSVIEALNKRMTAFYKPSDKQAETIAKN